MSWPAFNASLNALSAVFLSAGYFFIRRRRIEIHRACMLAAFTSSAIFLASYLLYHYQVGSIRFPGRGAAKAVYLTVLLSHTVLAVAIVPLALRALWLARKELFTSHARLARWTLPLWLYVSLTGVAVYWMLYRIKWS